MSQFVLKVSDEVQEKMKREAAQLAKVATNGKTMNQIRAIIYQMAIENMVLTLECNEHRPALGYDTMPTYKPRGM